MAVSTSKARAGVWRRLEQYVGRSMRDMNRADIDRWVGAHASTWSPATRRVYIAHVRAFYRLEGLADPVDVRCPTCGGQLPLGRS